MESLFSGETKRLIIKAYLQAAVKKRGAWPQDSSLNSLWERGEPEAALLLMKAQAFPPSTTHNFGITTSELKIFSCLEPRPWGLFCLKASSKRQVTWILPSMEVLGMKKRLISPSMGYLSSLERHGVSLFRWDKTSHYQSLLAGGCEKARRLTTIVNVGTLIYRCSYPCVYLFVYLSMYLSMYWWEHVWFNGNNWEFTGCGRDVEQQASKPGACHIYTTASTPCDALCKPVCLC